MRRGIASVIGCGLVVIAWSPASAQGYAAPKTPWGHEGNLAILQGLGGERAEDRAVEEDRQKGIIRARRPIQGGLTVGGQPIPESGPPASQP